MMHIQITYPIMTVCGVQISAGANSYEYFCIYYIRMLEYVVLQIQCCRCDFHVAAMYAVLALPKFTSERARQHPTSLTSQ
jgi:hypothetical protein